MSILDKIRKQLDEVKERVKDEVIKQKARDLSRQKAAELAAKLKSAPDFEKAAKAAKKPLAMISRLGSGVSVWRKSRTT